MFSKFTFFLDKSLQKRYGHSPAATRLEEQIHMLDHALGLVHELNRYAFYLEQYQPPSWLTAGTYGRICQFMTPTEQSGSGDGQDFLSDFKVANRIECVLMPDSFDSLSVQLSLFAKGDRKPIRVHKFVVSPFGGYWLSTR